MLFKDYITNYLKEQTENFKNVKPFDRRRFKIFQERIQEREKMIEESLESEDLNENILLFDEQTEELILRSPELIKKSILMDETTKVNIEKSQKKDFFSNNEE